MEEAIFMVVIEQYFTREGSKLLLPSKNEPCATKVVTKNGFQCKLLPQRDPCRHSGSTSDGSTNSHLTESTNQVNSITVYFQ